MSLKDFEATEGNGNVSKLTVRTPVYEDFEDSDRVYAEKVAELLKSKKLLLRSQLETSLKETGVWTDQDEKSINELNLKIDKSLGKLRKGGLKVSEGRKIAIEIYETRNEIVKVMRKRQVFDDVTVESMAENEKIDYIVYSCTVFTENGNHYWDSFEDMKNDKLSDAYRKASVTTMHHLYGIDPEFEKNLPETKWLKKFHFVDEEMNYIDRKTGERVDKEGRPIKELQEEFVKKAENLQGEIVSEEPFVDDETNKPVVVSG